MKFDPNQLYKIIYGNNFRKAVYMFSKGQVNHFEDEDGEFPISDGYITRGVVKIEACK